MNYWLVSASRRDLMSWDANGWTRLNLGNKPAQGDQMLLYVNDAQQLAAVGKVLGPTDTEGVLRVEPLVLFDFDWIPLEEIGTAWPPLAAGTIPDGITPISKADYDAAYALIRPLAEAAGLA